MSSSEFRQGYSESRPTSRVLRPPGGGSSNIFGFADEPSPPAAKPKVNRTEPTVIPKEPDSSPAPKAYSSNTHNNIFGDVTPAKGKVSTHNPITGLPYATKPEPIATTPTTESLPDPVVEDEGETTEANSEDPPPQDPISQSEIPRTRMPQSSTRVSQPPGGHCHKLW